MGLLKNGKRLYQHLWDMQYDMLQSGEHHEAETLISFLRCCFHYFFENMETAALLLYFLTQKVRRLEGFDVKPPNNVSRSEIFIDVSY